MEDAKQPELGLHYIVSLLTGADEIWVLPYLVSLHRVFLSHAAGAERSVLSTEAASLTVS